MRERGIREGSEDIVKQGRMHSEIQRVCLVAGLLLAGLTAYGDVTNAPLQDTGGSAVTQAVAPVVPAVAGISERTDLVSSAVPAWFLVMLSVVSGGLWVTGYRMRQRIRDGWLRVGAQILRLVAGTASFWCLLQAASRLFTLASPWPLVLFSFLAAGGTGFLLWLYRFERGVIPARTGRGITALRLALAAMLLWMLLQPVHRTELVRRIERTVVVLLDDSDSMRLQDLQRTAGEKLALAKVFGVAGADRHVKLEKIAADMEKQRLALAGVAERLRLPEGTGSDAVRVLLEASRDLLRKLLEQTLEATGASAGKLKLIDESVTLSVEVKNRLSVVRKALDETLPSLLDKASKRMKDLPDEPSVADAAGLAGALAGVAEALAAGSAQLLPISSIYDVAFLQALDEPSRKAVEALLDVDRATVARRCLTASQGQHDPILEQLLKRFQVKILRFGSETAELDTSVLLAATPAETSVAGDTNTLAVLDDPGVGLAPTPSSTTNAPPPLTREGAFGLSTDLSFAMEEAQRQIPADRFAGVLLLSDGRHNAVSGVEAAARLLGGLRVPVCAVPMGSAVPPADAAILSVTVPESIYLDDKVRVKADLKFDGLMGTNVTVRLLESGVELEKREIKIADKTFRTTERFMHKPETRGIMRYTLEIAGQDADAMPENNRRDLEVAVSDDRTNVLLVDSRPRWEFRYLRNLFYGRDKSVHLQYVLLEPDRLESAPDTEPVLASAGRKFGDAEATLLPANRDEWMKFDVIILGDIPPSALDEKTLAILRDCVTERGAMLVTIAGPRYMPHAFRSEIFKALLPVTVENTDAFLFESPDPQAPSFRLRLTPEGQEAPLMQLSSSAAENQQIWDELPPMRWRHANQETKPGAKVLAYADPLEPTEPKDLFDAPVLSPEDAADQLERRMRMRSLNALIVLQHVGYGKVLALQFDGTWRLRYRVGDTYHHTFWGQVLLAGGGENLRSGTALVRLGTDQLSYAPDTPIKVLVKLVEEDNRPVRDAKVTVRVYREQALLMSKGMTLREDSNGIYETELPGMQDYGKYRLEIVSKDAARLLSLEKADPVECAFSVVGLRNPAELAELTVDLGTLGKVAELSGGRVAGVDDVESLIDAFGAGTQTVHEPREVTLWDAWPLLLLMVCCVTAEWLLRRRAGLA